MSLVCPSCGGTQFAGHAYAMIGAQIGPGEAPLRDFDYLDIDSFEAFCDECGGLVADLPDDLWQPFVDAFRVHTSVSP